jgi:hypothetical protein
MNIDWDSNQYSDVSRHNEREQLIAAVKNASNGYGSMATEVDYWITNHNTEKARDQGIVTTYSRP